jgi:hypothetical protein
MDTLRFIITVLVSAAGVQDLEGAKSLLRFLRNQFTLLCCIWADEA